LVFVAPHPGLTLLPTAVTRGSRASALQENPKSGRLQPLRYLTVCAKG
jgi:hypothetical protein